MPVATFGWVLLVALEGSASGPATPSSTAPASRPVATRPHPLDALKPGEWYEAPNSHLRQVAFQWPAGTTPTLNGIGVKGVILCWSGGAYDTKRDRLVIWGGGHSAYSGNELYVFDVNALRWECVNDPSLDVDTKEKTEIGLYPDGTPRSSHSYNYIQYVPAVDRFVTLGAWACWPSGNYQTGITFFFDFEARKWERKTKGLAHGMGTMTAVDPVTGHLFARGNLPGSRFAEYDAIKDLWTDHTGDVSDWTCYGKTAAIDPIGRRFFAIGGQGGIYKYDIGAKGRVKQERIITQGPQEVVNAGGPADAAQGIKGRPPDRPPGLEYDPVLDRLVGWVEGTALFTLDLETLAWQKAAPAATNTVLPTKPGEKGTYGRFRYIPSKNAYVVANSVDDNVFFYRLTDRDAQPIPKRFVAALTGEDLAVALWVAGEVAKWKPEQSRPVLEAAREHHRKAGHAEVVARLEQLTPRVVQGQ